MPQTRITAEDVADWIEHNLACAQTQFDSNPSNQCALDVLDKWRICKRYFDQGKDTTPKPMAEKPTTKFSDEIHKNTT
jgi:hypothetical protein